MSQRLEETHYKHHCILIKPHFLFKNMLEHVHGMLTKEYISACMNADTNRGVRIYV